MPLNAGKILKLIRYNNYIEMRLSPTGISLMPFVKMALIFNRYDIAFKIFQQNLFNFILYHCYNIRMRRVKLKEKSPEFDDESVKKPNTRCCDIDGCNEDGLFRAPRDRNLSSYYTFCQKHVSDYNRAWNFFDGMSDADVQNHVYSSLFGDRPTWKYAPNRNMEDDLRDKAFGFRNADHAERVEAEKERRRRERMINPQTPEGEAMQIMELSPPLSMDALKSQYKKLAKQYHPDVNKNDPEAEEKLKDINMAYTVLRLAHQKYENLT